ncbi:MAG: metallopeptidase TldD-related protein [Bryobacteraceae bacterium]
MLSATRAVSTARGWVHCFRRRRCPAQCADHHRRPVQATTSRDCVRRGRIAIEQDHARRELGEASLIRMTNVSLLPGRQTLDEVFDVDHAIYMNVNRSWSIDDKRYNFQFGCEAAWEIRNGKRVRMLKNPTYSGISTDFWNSCDAIAGPEDWTLWGVPNCGKGQPEQTMGTGHGASPSRFRNIKIGSANLD